MADKIVHTGVVTWTHESYRSNAGKEYDDFWPTVIREAVQNSVDANSRDVFIGIEEFKVGGWELSISDDGCGMNLDTILNKLLVIGGSDKSNTDEDYAAGGLGKAKEALFFSHKFWKIITNGHMIKGNGPHFEIIETSEPIEGTQVLLHINERENIGDVIDGIKRVLKRCETPKCRLYYQMDLIPPLYQKGKMVRDLGFGKVYQLKSSMGEKLDYDEMGVRVNGVWMHDKYIGYGFGRITIELDPSIHPLKMMKASRDELKWEYSNKLDEFIQELVVDRRSALDKPKEPEMAYILGNGPVQIDISEIKSEARKLYDAEFDTGVLELQDVLALGELGSIRQDQILHSLSSDDNERDALKKYECLLTLLGYEPDFILYMDPEKDMWAKGRINRFMQTPKAATIAKIWTEIVRQVLIDVGKAIRFTAGFCFDKRADAQHLKQNGEHHFFVNPAKVAAVGIQANHFNVNDLRTRAVHEVVHIEMSRHDEDFISRYHEFDKMTWGSWKIYSKIGRLRGTESLR